MQIHTLNLWILRCAQYDKIYKFNKICKYDKNLEHKKRLRDYSLNLLWIATLAKLVRNDGGIYHFERSALARSEKSKEF